MTLVVYEGPSDSGTFAYEGGEYTAARGVAIDVPLDALASLPSGWVPLAHLGDDGTVGGPHGSVLTPSVVSGDRAGSAGGAAPAVSKVPVSDGSGGWAWGASGGGGGGNVVVHKFPFAFDLGNLHTGADVVCTDGYSYAAGDLLLDAWFQVDTAWDGITPHADFLFALNGSGVLGAGGFDMSSPDGIDQGVQLGLSPGGSLSTSRLNLGAPFARWQGVLQDPTSWGALQVVVSRDGSITGGDPGSTVGAAVFYLMTARL